jgi:hypothetical protein
LNATGQVTSATDTGHAAWSSAEFQEFQAFKRAKEQQQQRHQQLQQQQAEECAQIASEFDRWDISNTCNAITEVIECNNVNACNPMPPLFLHLKPVGKPIFRVKVLADTGARRSLISLSTANKHGCKIRETDVRLSAANGTKIDVAGTTSLQVVEKGQLVHTIVAIVSPNITQTIVESNNWLPDVQRVSRREKSGKLAPSTPSLHCHRRRHRRKRRKSRRRQQEKRRRSSPDCQDLSQSACQPAR